MKKLKPWFDEERLRFSDQRKQAKMQWLQNPNHSNVDTLNNVRCKANRYFKNIKKEYLKAKIDELETNSKITTIGDLGVSDLRRVISLELTW